MKGCIGNGWKLNVNWLKMKNVSENVEQILKNNWKWRNVLEIVEIDWKLIKNEGMYWKLLETKGMYWELLKTIENWLKMKECIGNCWNWLKAD